MRLLALAITVVAALLLSVLPASAAQKNAASPIESLSAAQRASLPDATLVTVTFAKTVRTVSLGTLRSEHQLRLQRFANAAKLGALARAPEQKLVPGKVIKKLVPMNYSLTSFNIVASGASYYPGPLPADFLAFCKAARATGCLYFPSGAPLMFVNNQSTTSPIVDEDPLITDAQLCKSEGGSMWSWPKIPAMCVYEYPVIYTLDFNPGTPTAQGYPVTSFGNCKSQLFTKPAVDPHGALALGVATTILGNGYPLTAVASCVVDVFVPASSR
jgi:hypothetical protein